MTSSPTPNRSLLLAIVAGLGASACCIGPLLLLSLGIGGAWVGNLTAMEPYSGYFTVITLIILGVVFYKLYIAPQKCEDGSICANPKVLKNQRIMFWIVSIILIVMMSFPYYAEYIIA
ncbi:mercuric transporter MerT family protein [Colwellia sp. 1_MG-2023]|jgi:mercuric ion transport protein|uniref:mercuric transporter MerT family protein n=1 Tax=Colwelliaceae TaxID=267889 RepID=UPI0009858FA5|nr:MULTISPECIES: mercuric transporter MerT family protein [Colwelliaceae]MDO6445663.1 mercuric transporter MerT family protein [Colwellia sp. 1_MG-2023]|tara:strand:- start:677 stop:1030 length:354 start_codon:yes stop_codon:yes gene_type:complete